MALEREVLVKLNLVPDASAASKIKAMEASITALQAKASNVRVDIKGGAGGNPLDRQIKEIESNLGRVEKQIDQITAKRVAAEQKAAAAAQAASVKIKESHLQALNATKGAIGGLLSMAEGIALLGITADEDLAVFVEQFKDIRAGFQILSGGIEIVTNLAGAYKALAAASVAGVGGVGGKVAGSVVAGAGGAAGRGVMGGLGTIATAGALKLGGLGVAGGAAVFEGVQALRRGQFSSEGFENTSKESFFTSALPGMIKAQFFDLAKSTKDVAEAEQKRLVVIEAVKQAEISRLSIIGQNRAAQEGIASRRDAAMGLTGEAAISASRNRGLSALEQAEAQLANVRPDNMQAELAAMQNIVTLKEQIAAADEASLAAQRENLQTIQQSLKVAEGLVRQAQERVRAETQGAKSSLARFGELDPSQQQSLREISEKVKRGGSINQLEADMLKQTGFGGGLVQDFNAAKGSAAGGEAALEGLGELEGLKAARDAEAEAARQVARLKEEEQEAIRKTNEASARLVTTLDKLSEALQALADRQLRGVDETRDETINPGAKANQVFQNQRADAVAQQAGRGNRVAAGVGNALE